MNRAERRRQDKAADRALKSDRGRELAPLLSEGMAHHRAGRLQEAEHCYQRALELVPSHPEALHLLGLVAYRAGQLDRAVALLSEAIQGDPRNATYHFNLGVVQQRDARHEEASQSYRTAVTLDTGHVEAWNNLGNTLRQLGRIDEAIAAYERAVERKPDYVEAHNNLGVASKEQGLLERALASYDRALQLNPNHPETHWNRGLVWQELGRLDEALEAFETAIRIRPDYAKAHHSLGLVHLWQQRLDRAMPAFRRSAALQHDHQRPVSIGRLHRSRIKHDLEQAQYLMERGLLGPEHRDYLETLRELQKRAAWEESGSRYLQPEENESRAIAPSFNRLLHQPDCSALVGGALNPDLDVEEIERRYHAKKPEIMFVDHLLHDDALESLRRFCREATIWKRDYDNGYLGTFLGEGFASPLLLQISEELRLRFPRIFKNHRLNQAWAFKYDSELTGLNVHADAAAVNVNFWITEDAANLDPEGGGLVVWDKEAPKEWNFKEYNNVKNKHKIFEFLEAQGAEAVTIPYRENRAVIFNSDLFHETGRLRFKEGYENRRINVTLLYGYRSKDG